MGTTSKARNYMLGNSGVMRWSSSASFGKKARYKFAKPGQKAPAKPAAKPKMVEKTVGGEKNGGTRLVQVKRMRKSYPTQECPRLLKSKHTRFRDHKRKLRASITPGTVLILVAGPYKGKHVVFLKQLGTGLLLVTGPYVLNGCPLRRVNQRYVIATKTKLDISKVEVPENVNDLYFKKEKTKKTKPAEGEIFASKKEKFVASPERKADQVAVDKQLIAAIKSREDKKLMFGYLKSDFSLKNHQYPHNMLF
ncbi:large ribosomal subunit protein eL6-like [Watersipora subatra]|uniref:large ribosomal subunit protein eL6-like n=1 Tax=Watersipora subatra TaxID=2589382 RepID=UPI00355BE5A2